MLSVILLVVSVIWRACRTVHLMVISLVELVTALTFRMATQHRVLDTLALLHIRGGSSKIDTLKDLVIKAAQLEHHSDRDTMEYVEICSLSSDRCWVGYVHKRGGRFVEGFAEDLGRLSVVSRSKELSAGCLPSSSYICVDMKRHVSWLGRQIMLWRARKMLKATKGKADTSDLVWHDPRSNTMTVATRIDGCDIHLITK